MRGPERIQKLISSINDNLIDKINKTLDAIPKTISDSISRLKEEIENLAGGNFATVIYMFVLAIVGLLAAMLLLDMSPKVAFANSILGSKAKNRRKSTKARKKK